MRQQLAFLRLSGRDASLPGDPESVTQGFPGVLWRRFVPSTVPRSLGVVGVGSWVDALAWETARVSLVGKSWFRNSSLRSFQSPVQVFLIFRFLWITGSL